MPTLVSVIIPTYNAAKYIEAAINSAINQTWKNLEIIVVDDGSTDDTVRIAESYDDNRLSIIKQQHKGACAARNNGFTHSTGSFIQFLDADDILAPEKIAAQMKLLANSGVRHPSIAHCCFYRFAANNVYSVNIKEPHKSIRRHLTPADWLVANRITVTGCWLVPRKLIERAGLWNEDLIKNQDEEFFARLVIYAGQVLYCAEARLHYRSDSLNSISKNSSKQAASSKLDAVELIEQKVLEHYDCAATRKMIANKYLECYYLSYIPYPDLAAIAEAGVCRLGSVGTLPGGIVLQAVSKLFGWKSAMKIKRMIKPNARLFLF